MKVKELKFLLTGIDDNKDIKFVELKQLKYEYVSIFKVLDTKDYVIINIVEESTK